MGGYGWQDATSIVDKEGKLRECIGIRQTLDRYGEILLNIFSYKELEKAYGPIFVVWLANHEGLDYDVSREE